ncbi:MAG: tetratricopeptide repeat protein [Thermoanaerobaculia bacterium]
MVAVACLLMPPIVISSTARASETREVGAGAIAELLREGRELLQAGDAAAAVGVLERAVEVAPESADGHALLGRALALDDRYLAAEEALRKAIALGRQDLATWFYLGSTLWENGRLGDAEEAFRTALERGGRAPLLVYQLGRLLLWQGRGAEAVTLLREASETTPGAPDVLLDLARALESAGDLQAAREAYGRAVELAPEDSHARYGLAAVLGRLGESEAAARERAVYRRLYEEEQERVRQEGLTEARVARGQELVRTGRAREAIVHLRALPETATSLAALAEAYLAAGDATAALHTLERAVVLAPERDDLRARLNEARLRLHENP